MNLWFYILLIITGSWFVFMTWLSHQNGNDTGETSRHLAEELGEFLHDVDISELNGKLRRVAHTVVCAVLTILVLTTVFIGGGRWKAVLIAVILLLFWAWCDEYTKPLMEKLGIIPGRHFSWVDVRLNVLGVVIGAIVVTVIKIIF